MAAARHQVAKTEDDHRRDFVEFQFAAAGNRIGRVAPEKVAAEAEGLAAGHSGVCVQLVAVINEHPRAQMEAAARRKPIEQHLSRSQMECSMIVNAVTIET